MRVVAFWLIVLSCAPFARASQTIAMRELHVDGIYATRSGDPTLYCLLGANACIVRFPNDAWNQDALITRWLAAHPDAEAVPISSRGWRIGKAGSLQPREYLWVEDHGESLNVVLVREGHYAAGAMIDMVDAQRQMLSSMGPLGRDIIAEELARTPEEDKARRLVTDADYLAKLRLVSIAESDAKADQRGIWSEAGFPGRAPPKDSYMIRQFQTQRDAFERVRVLISSNPRLTAINRNTPTAESARSAGVPASAVEEYVRLVRQLNTNGEISGIDNLGDVCLVVSDIVYGAFDNGIIKGFVFGPKNPIPVVESLDSPAAEISGGTAYRQLDGDWYLFEMQH